MSRKHVPDWVSMQSIVNRQHRSSWVAKDDIHTLLFQRLNQDISPAAFQFLFRFFFNFYIYSQSLRLLLDYVFGRIKKAFSSLHKETCSLHRDEKASWYHPISLRNRSLMDKLNLSFVNDNLFRPVTGNA